MSYTRFGAMVATSTVVMFVLRYLNVFALDHVFFTQTRTWMAIYMGAAMAIIMPAFMLGMYRGKATNVAIFGGRSFWEGSQACCDQSGERTRQSSGVIQRGSFSSR